MAILRSLPLCVLTGALLAAGAAQAQTAATAIAIPNRIVNPIDESRLVTLGGTVHPLANARNDRGVAADGLQLGRMHLVLKHSAAQEAALKQLIAEMHTPGSANYHKWLTPAEFGAQFGPSDQDIAAVTTWLNNQGFNVSKVDPGKQTIEFTGSVAQLRSAFRTQIRKYEVNGEMHYANANAPEIPSALAPVVAGFTSLNNFRPRSYAHKLGEATFNRTTHQLSQWTWGNSSGVNYVLAPGDFAKQYDLSPLYSANINGTGQTIAIVNDSNINVDLVNQFRTLFGLPANPPQVIIDGNDPGVDGTSNPDGPNGDSVEAYLDVEWAGAVAPNATVDLVISADTALETGLVLAMERAVYGNIAPIVSVSFGSCEANLGANNSFFNSLWEQAAAQGQTVIVSTGDNGSAGCDDDTTQEYAIYGQAVNGFASTPYNVAVGGTDFYYSQYASPSALDTQLAGYWDTTTSQSPSVSLQTVIPEQPWNASQFGLNAVNQYNNEGTTSIAGGSGGASNCATLNTSSACAAGYAKPAWQKLTLNGTQYVPSDGVRDLPDVSLFASSGSNYTFYPICATDGDCQPASGSDLVQIFGVGGTSASAPAFAGMMALVLQSTGSRQGQADAILYPLKAQYPSAFHDVTNGTNSVPCSTGTTNCIPVSSPITLGSITEGQIGTGTTPEYNATAGYNLATGLGTIDAYNLVTNWSKVTLASTTTAMTLTAPSGVSLSSIPHGTALSIAGTVTGSGSPSGNVALMTDSTEPLQQGQGAFALSSGSYSGSGINYLPGGTYNVWAQYGGDGANGMSTSTKTQITVTPEAAAVDLNLFNTALNAYLNSSTSNSSTQITYGTQLVVSALVAPTANNQAANLQSCLINNTNCSSIGTYTQPTGTITFTDNSSTINTAVINAEGDAEYNAPFAVGSHSVSAKYNGDQSYNAVTASSPIAFSVIKDSPAIGIDASNETSQGVVYNGQPTVFNVIVENGSQYSAYSQTSSVAPVPVLPPTGTVVVSSSPSGISGTVTLSAGVDPSDGAQAGIGVLTVPSTLPAGTYTISLVYSGDSNYQGNAGSPISGQIQVSAPSGLASTTTAVASGSISPNSTVTVTGTVTGQSGHAAPTGTVTFFSSTSSIGYVTLTPGSGSSSTFSAALKSQTLSQGANFITLQYWGDGTYAPSNFALANPISNSQSDFSLTAASSIVPVSIASGAGSATDTINLASVNGFAGNVNLTCAAASPVTCSFSSSQVALANQGSASTTLTIDVPAGTANGSYNVVITGTDAATGVFIHTLAIAAQVSGSSSATADFSLSASSNNITVASGSTGSTTVTVTPTSGFTGTVALTCSITPPSGVTNTLTCGFSPTSVSITGTSALTSTFTASATSNTASGTYTITVTGTSGSTQHTIHFTVTVNPPFAITGGNISLSPGATSGNTTIINVTPTGGFTGTVNLTCAITPTAASNPATCSLSQSSVNITSASAVTSTLTITTTAATAYNRPLKLFLPAGGGAVLAIAFFFVPRRRRNWLAMFGLLVLVVSGLAIGCGGGSTVSGGGGSSPSNGGTTPGTYTVTITGTSGTTQATGTLSLTVL